MMKLLVCSFVLCSFMSVSLFSMDRDFSNPFLVGFQELPQEMNKEIFDRIITSKKFTDIAPALNKIAISSRKNNEFINSKQTTQNLIEILNQRTKNKVRAARILKTKGAQEWLNAYLKTEQGRSERDQMEKDKLDLQVAITIFGLRPLGYIAVGGKMHIPKDSLVNAIATQIKGVNRFNAAMVEEIKKLVEMGVDPNDYVYGEKTTYLAHLKEIFNSAQKYKGQEEVASYAANLISVLEAYGAH